MQFYLQGNAIKKIFVIYVFFSALLFVVSCGGGSNKDDKTDSGETVTDGDTADTEPAGDLEPSDTTPDDGDSVDTTPDSGDSTDSMPDDEVVTTPCNPNPCWILSASTGKCTEKEETYECECSENYVWKDGDCVGDTQKVKCEDLPENAEWIGATEVTQTWNGSIWEPSTVGVYNEEAADNECRFKCEGKYEWDGAKCTVVIPPCSAENADKTCKDYETGYIWSVKSDGTYTVRFGIVALMTHYLDDCFRPEYLDVVANVRSSEYYIQMAVAWFFATALSTQYEKTFPYIANRKLDATVLKMTVQKARESFRISEEQKAELKQLIK